MHHKFVQYLTRLSFQVVATEVAGGGKFYVQLTDYQKEASIIQQQLASLKLQEAPALGSFNPEKGELVLAQFRGDNSWNRAMVRNIYVYKFTNFSISRT